MNIKKDFFETVCPGFKEGVVKVYYSGKVVAIGHNNTTK